MMTCERIFFSVFDVLTFSILGIVDTVIFDTVIFDIWVCCIVGKVVLGKVVVGIATISFWLCVFLVVVRKKDLRKQERLRVQVYNCEDNVKHFVEDLLKQVNKELDVKYITDAHDISQNVPLLVICFNVCRLGVDARNAIDEITDLRSAVLLVFYHKEDYDLPLQHSDTQLVGDEFSNLYGIYDIACVTGKGVYQHDMNTQSISKVKQYIDAYQHKNIP